MARRRGVHFIVINVKGREDSCIKRHNHSWGFDQIWHTKRSDVPRLKTLHLWCVWHFTYSFPFCRSKHERHDSPRPAERRVNTSYRGDGILSYRCWGYPDVALNYYNSYTNPNSNRNPMYTSISVITVNSTCTVDPKSLNPKQKS